MTDTAHAQGKQPKGLLGYIIGMLMNATQTAGHYAAFKKIISEPVDKLLDIGCGGGAFLNKLAKSGIMKKGFGLDHSDQMVALAKRKNRQFIQPGLIKIFKGSVTDLNFPDGSFSVVTAFETIQYWPELNNAIKEVYRVLEKNGHFIIVNRYPDEGSPWCEKIQIKNKTAYINLLEANGFTVNKATTTQRRGWIIIDTEK